MLILLVSPFAGVRWGLGDDRNLPTSVSSRQVGDQMRSDFAHNSANDFQVVVPHIGDANQEQIAAYSAALSRIPDVRAVSSTTGPTSNGMTIGPASTSAGAAGGSMYLTVSSDAPPFTERAETQLDLVRAVASPGGGSVEVTGMTQINRDNNAAVTGRLPLVLAAIFTVTFVLMFLADRQRGAACQDVRAQHPVAHRRIRCGGVDLQGRPPRRAGHDSHGHLGHGIAGHVVLVMAFGLDGLRSLSDGQDPRILARIHGAKSTGRQRRRVSPLAGNTPDGSSPPRHW